MDLNELLSGNPSWNKVAEYFKSGEFYDEGYLVSAIRKYLLTEEQKNSLNRINLSIEDCLNGRFGENEEKVVLDIFAAWNAKLGFRQFGF